MMGIEMGWWGGRQLSRGGIIINGFATTITEVVGGCWRMRRRRVVEAEGQTPCT
jgi:hypothetical protein